jgi:chromosomal replication initiation ATPase DnaA
MRPENLQAVWTEISSALREAVSEDTFVRWFKDAELVALTEDDLTLRVPNNILSVWIEANYLPLLQSAITLALGDRRRGPVCLLGENPRSPSRARS